MEYKNENRICQNCKKDFTIEPDDFSFYEKIKVPPPTWCWKCRAKRRMSFRNFRYLYDRICPMTGEKIFTTIPPSAPMPAYERDYWMSDKWDAIDYGKEYDFNRPFFEQFKELYHSVPATNTLNQNQVNSEYSSGLDLKNCYLCFDAGYSEDSSYGVTLQKSKQCYDTINCKLSELCYWSINITQCYRAFFSRNCTSCVDMWFSQDCVGCNNCFGCTNLRNKNYYIFNQPYSREEYDKKLKEYNLSSWNTLMGMRVQAENFWLTYPTRFRHGLKDSGCSGDYIFNSAQLRNCFFANGAQNCVNSQSIIYDPIRDSMDVTSSGIDIELDYEVSGCGTAVHNLYFGVDCFTTSDSKYAINCRQVNDCFGCVALSSKKYCILNKQYTKEEYKTLVPKIIEHMNTMPYVDEKGRVYKYGEFFPPTISPFGYNESQAYEYFALSKEEVEEMGFSWRIPEKKNYKITKSSNELPQDINDVDDSITQEVISCMHEETGGHKDRCGENCPRAFRITPEELQFYRAMKLPLPRICFNCRHVDRVGWRNVPQLYSRVCMCSQNHTNHEGKCQEQFETSYAPDRSEIVYCEKCYQQEVV
jgi:hypothetical protein